MKCSVYTTQHIGGAGPKPNRKVTAFSSLTYLGSLGGIRSALKTL